MTAQTAGWLVVSKGTPKAGDTVQVVPLGQPIPSSTPKLPLQTPARSDAPKATRGTSNANDRGSAADRRRRRAWLMECYASDVPGFVRCYRCGFLLFNPDAPPEALLVSMFPGPTLHFARPLTVDRIIPGCQGGTYRRTNIRPACGPCNSETGGALARRGGSK